MIERSNSKRVLHFNAKAFESSLVCSSVTRFGNISPLWQNLQSWAIFLFLFGNIFDLLWQILNDVWQIFEDANGQMLEHNPSIWSHWHLGTPTIITGTLYPL